MIPIMYASSACRLRKCPVNLIFQENQDKESTEETPPDQKNIVILALLFCRHDY